MPRFLVSSSTAPRPPGPAASTLATLALGAVGGLAAVGALAIAAVANGHLALRAAEADGPRVRVGKLRVDRLKVEHLHVDAPRPVADRLFEAAETLVTHNGNPDTRP